MLGVWLMTTLESIDLYAKIFASIVISVVGIFKIIDYIRNWRKEKPNPE